MEKKAVDRKCSGCHLKHIHSEVLLPIPLFPDLFQHQLAKVGEINHPILGNSVWNVHHVLV